METVQSLQKDNERLTIYLNYFENKSTELEKAFVEANERIKELEEVSQIWIKRSLIDSSKLISANERIRFLEEMITNGLGWEDMKNDI